MIDLKNELLIYVFFSSCSVGSLGGHGAEEFVHDLHVKNCTINGATSGVKIKTWPVSNATILKSNKLNNNIIYYFIKIN